MTSLQVKQVKERITISKQIMTNTITVPVTRFGPNGKQDAQNEVACEMPLTIFLNGRELLTTLCSPKALDYLAVGVLLSEGLITRRSDLCSIKVKDECRVYVESVNDVNDKYKALKPLIASSGGKGSSSYGSSDIEKESISSKLRITAEQVLHLTGNFLSRSSIYKATHGVHSAALCDPNHILLFQDDIGRHNALDKIFGECFLKDTPLVDSIIITSGRVSSEILLKIAKRGVPILVSKAPPTAQGIMLARDIGVTIIQATRDDSLFVYSCSERVFQDSNHV